MSDLLQDPGVQGLAQLGRNAIERVTELERELAAAVAERDELRAEHGPRVTQLFEALAERDQLRARLAAIDAAPTVAVARFLGAWEVELLGDFDGVGTELIARPAKEAT